MIKQFKSLYSLFSLLIIIPSNLLAMELSQKPLLLAQNYQFVKVLQKAIEAFKQKNNLSDICQFQIITHKDFYLQAHEGSSTVLTVFKLPHASAFNTISNQEAARAHQLLKVYDIQSQNGICSLMFKCFDRQLLPVTKEQAGFLLIAPLLKETIRKTELVSPAFLKPEQKQILCQNLKHTELIVMQRNECKSFFESGKLASVFKIESHIESSDISFQAIQKLNYVLHLYHKGNALEKAALRTEVVLHIDQVCDHALHEGFALGMVVHTATDFKKIEDIQAGELVRAQDLENDIQVLCPVTHICKEIIPCYAKITLDHETIITALGQKFHLDNVGWVTAHDLIQSPELQTYFPSQIIEIQQINESIEVYKLTVAHEHNFYVTEQQLLAHNFIPLVTVVGAAATPILIPIAKGIGAVAFGWIGSKILASLAPHKKESEDVWQEYHKAKHDSSKKDQHHNIPDKKTTQSQLQSGGCGGPGGPNGPNGPKKNGNHNYKKPDNDDKKKDKDDKKKKEQDDKKKDEKKNNKDSEQKKNKNNEKKNEPAQQKPQKELNPKGIFDYIVQNKDSILKSIDPALKNIEKNGNTIKQITPYAFNLIHIFSKNHLKDGLLKLGEHLGNISQAAQFVSEKIIEIVGNADKIYGLKEGLNPIQTFINELPIEIHVFMENNIVINFNAFIGHSVRSAISPNLIKI